MKALLGAVALAVALATTPIATAQADEPSPADGGGVVDGVQVPSVAPTATAPTPTPTPTPPPPTPTPTPAPPAPTPAPPTTSPTPTEPPARPALRARQRLVLTGDRDGDRRADNGDSYRVLVTVTNTGNVTLGRVRIADALVSRRGSSVSCGTTTLAVGQSTTCSSGRVPVTRGEARTGKVVNKARARAQTPSRTTVVSAVSSRTLTVQPIAHKHKHKHKHKKRHKHRQHHKHGKLHKHKQRHRRQHRPRPRARLEMTQYVVGVSDANHNGRLQGGDSVRFGFRLVNSGTVSLAGLSVVDRRLVRFKVPITCGTSTLAPGETTTCTSAALRITPFQDAKDKLGRNFAYATATTSTGTAARSNSTKLTLVRSTRALQLLANTGSDVSAGEVVSIGALLSLGALLMGAGRRRRRAAHS